SRVVGHACPLMPGMWSLLYSKTRVERALSSAALSRTPEWCEAGAPAPGGGHVVCGDPRPAGRHRVQAQPHGDRAGTTPSPAVTALALLQNPLPYSTGGSSAPAHSE